MTRKRYIKLVVALCEKLQKGYDGKHLNGETLKFYRERSLKDMPKYSSYADAWNDLKPARDCVEM